MYHFFLETFGGKLQPTQGNVFFFQMLFQMLLWNYLAKQLLELLMLLMERKGPNSRTLLNII